MPERTAIPFCTCDSAHSLPAQRGVSAVAQPEPRPDLSRSKDDTRRIVQWESTPRARRALCHNCGKDNAEHADIADTPTMRLHQAQQMEASHDQPLMVPARELPDDLKRHSNTRIISKHQHSIEVNSASDCDIVLRGLAGDKCIPQWRSEATASIRLG